MERDVLSSKFVGILGLANQCFKFYFSNRKQNVSIPQRSVLRPFLFLIYINNINQAIKVCEVHHFVDKRNFLHFSKSVDTLNQCVNLDLKNFTDKLNVNKNLLRVKKNELVIFQTKKNK